MKFFDWLVNKYLPFLEKGRETKDVKNRLYRNCLLLIRLITFDYIRFWMATMLKVSDDNCYNLT